MDWLSIKEHITCSISSMMIQNGGQCIGAHATSKDLIHWEEQPIALYPDANGAMFSGCIVADEKNTSGLLVTAMKVD